MTSHSDRTIRIGSEPDPVADSVVRRTNERTNGRTHRTTTAVTLAAGPTVGARTAIRRFDELPAAPGWVAVGLGLALIGLGEWLRRRA